MLSSCIAHLRVFLAFVQQQLDAPLHSPVSTGHVRLWDSKTASKPIGEALKGHSKWITLLPIHINPSSPHLASSSKDGVWSTLTRLTEYILSGHLASVNVVVEWGSADGPRGILYTASSDRRPTGKEHAHWVTTLTLNIDFVLRKGSFDHTGKRPISDEAQQLAKARYKRLLRTTPELVIFGSDDHTLFLWSPFPSSSSYSSSGQHSNTKPVTGHQRQISHVAFSPDGRWAASAAWDDSVRVWEGRTRKFIATLRRHIGAVGLEC